MPITITPAPPNGVITPSGWINVQSSFVGPPSSAALWDVTTFSLGATEEVVTWDKIPFQSNPQQLFLAQPSTQVHPIVQSGFPKEGDSVNVIVKLEDTSGLLDQDVITAPWSPTAGVNAQIQAWNQSSAGGLTPQQAQQIDETWQASYPSVSLDSFTTVFHGSGSASTPVNFNLPVATFGVIVRLTGVDPSLQPVTPDGDYWVKTLAVVRLFRGSDLWHRYPVHTSSKIISFYADNILVAVSAVSLTQWLLNMSVQVTFLAGVTGDVYSMPFP